MSGFRRASVNDIRARGVFDKKEHRQTEWRRLLTDPKLLTVSIVGRGGAICWRGAGGEGGLIKGESSLARCCVTDDICKVLGDDERDGPSDGRFCMDRSPADAIEIRVQ